MLILHLIACARSVTVADLRAARPMGGDTATDTATDTANGADTGDSGPDDTGEGGDSGGDSGAPCGALSVDPDPVTVSNASDYATATIYACDTGLHAACDGGAALIYMPDTVTGSASIEVWIADGAWTGPRSIVCYVQGDTLSGSFVAELVE